MGRCAGTPEPRPAPYAWGPQRLLAGRTLPGLTGRAIPTVRGAAVSHEDVDDCVDRRADVVTDVGCALGSLDSEGAAA